MFKVPVGINFSSENLPASELARILCRIASFIQNVEPESNTAKLQKFDDWLEHDGLYFYKGEISLHELFDIVKSPQALLERMPGDENVFIGISPNSSSWYLRFYLSWDDEGFNLLGRFNITLPLELSIIFRQQIAQNIDLSEQNSEAYFSSFH